MKTCFHCSNKVQVKETLLQFAFCFYDKTITQSNSRRKRFIWLTNYSSSLREVQAETEENTMQHAAHRIFLSHAQLALLYSRPILLETVPPTMGWALILVSNYDSATYICPQTQLTRVLPPRWLYIMLSCQKLTRVLFLFFHRCW